LLLRIFPIPTFDYKKPFVGMDVELQNYLCQFDVHTIENMFKMELHF